MLQNSYQKILGFELKTHLILESNFPRKRLKLNCFLEIESVFLFFLQFEIFVVVEDKYVRKLKIFLISAESLETVLIFGKTMCSNRQILSYSFFFIQNFLIPTKSGVFDSSKFLIIAFTNFFVSNKFLSFQKNLAFIENNFAIISEFDSKSVGCSRRKKSKS